MSPDPQRLNFLALRISYATPTERAEIAAALRELARRISCELPPAPRYPDWITRTNRED